MSTCPTCGVLDRRSRKHGHRPGSGSRMTGDVISGSSGLNFVIGTCDNLAKDIDAHYRSRPAMTTAMDAPQLRVSRSTIRSWRAPRRGPRSGRCSYPTHSARSIAPFAFVAISAMYFDAIVREPTRLWVGASRGSRCRRSSPTSSNRTHPSTATTDVRVAMHAAVVHGSSSTSPAGARSCGAPSPSSRRRTLQMTAHAPGRSTALESGGHRRRAGADRRGDNADRLTAAEGRRRPSWGRSS